MAPIKDLQLTYEAPNPENAFSAGDVITGVVTFTVTRETKVQSLLVKVKGDAHVGWRETKGVIEISYSDHKRFFKVKQNLVAENLKGNVLHCAVHSFHFKLRIPQGNIPPSFKGDDARIVYMLEAKISWSWHQISSVTKELNVLSLPLIAQTNLPLARIASKKVGICPKRLVRLSAVLQKRVYSPGDTVSVVAKITNSSSRRMIPKFSLLQTTRCCVGGHTHGTDKILYEAVGKTIKEDTEETITCLIKIPVDATPTFFNCEMISVHYSLKVDADISKVDVPVVTLPLFIAPHRFASQQCCGIAIHVESLLHRDLPLPAFVVRSGVVPAPQNAFEYPEPDPTHHANTSGNQWSLQVSPYSSPQSPPPSYDSLYPTPHDVNVTNRQVKISKL